MILVGDPRLRFCIAFWGKKNNRLRIESYNDNNHNNNNNDVLNFHSVFHNTKIYFA